MEVIIKRNSSVYSDRDLAIEALNNLNYELGQLVCSSYLEATEQKILLVIGISEGIGKYKIISSFSDIQDITEALGALSQGLQEHISTLVTGSVSGHVINSLDSDINFTDGKGIIKEGVIELSHFASTNISGIVGITSGSVDSGNLAPMDFLSWSEVISEIEKEGSVSIQTREGQSISLSGKSGDIVVTIGNNIILPGNPSIGVGITVGSALDKDGSLEIANIDYVRKKINEILTAADAMHYSGPLDPTITKLPTGNAGDTYVVSKNSTIDSDLTGLGVMHVGDMIICKTDNTVAEYPQGWELIETHGDTIFGPSGSGDQNVMIFSGSSGKVAGDSGISIGTLVKNTRKVIGSDGLIMDTGNSLGTLDKDILIKHAPIIPTITGSSGVGKFISGISEDQYGHVTKVVYTSETQLSQGSGTGTTGGIANSGKYVSGVLINNHEVTVNATDFPGTVKIDSSGTPDYLINQIIPKTNLGTDEYSVRLTKNTTSGKLEASVIINRIDGGTY